MAQYHGNWGDTMQGWVDYYGVLSVNQHAVRKDIEARYKQLCKVFHPDVNHSGDAEEQMKLINMAWEVLRDDGKRSAFHKEWEVRQRASLSAVKPQPRGTQPAQPTYTRPARPVVVPEDLEARRAISDYFRGIMGGHYDAVYDLLSSRDRRNITQESFHRWQASVAKSYHIESFLVLSRKKYDAFPMGDMEYPAERFSIEITERDINKNVVGRYKLVKFVVHEGDVWHVYLGYRDIEYVVEQFSLLAGSAGDFVARSTDPLTGLPNRRGFLDKCRPEVYRSVRYGRECALGVVTVHFSRDIADPDLHRRILQQTGFSLRAAARLIDIVGVLADHRFCVLLAETTEDEARRAAQRLARKVEGDILACFDTQIKLSINTLPYDGGDLAQTLERCEGKK
jgi:diguanylate cyclase (GGDEF)-like protein